MEIYKAVILGIIQGLTEFLPISSSGHLVLFQQLFGLNEPDLFFDISLHIGTLFAVLIVFRNEIIQLLMWIFNFLRGKYTFMQAKKSDDFNFIIMLLCGSVPTAIIGLMINKYADIFYSSILLVGFMLIITGIILQRTKNIKAGVTDDKSKRTLKNAFIIGTIQGFAVIPGISRSGSTIATALFLGMSKKFAARYSFLLSVIAIVGAEFLTILKSTGNHSFTEPYILYGITASFISGYIALKLLITMLDKGKFYLFAPYCFIVGVIAIISGLI